MVGKKKRSLPAVIINDSVNQPEVEVADSTLSALATPGDQESVRKHYCFKDQNFELSKGGGPAKKAKVWKNLKQIVTTERTQLSRSDDALYSSIDAPPSFRPAKKYSDLSGLPAPYTDPRTLLRYATAEEYSRILLLPMDIVAGLLTLRHANGNPVQ